MKLAAAAYPLDFFDTWADYAAKLSAWVAEAAEAGADLLVFPEYGALELASLGGRAVAADQEGVLRETARHRAPMEALHAELARRHGVCILSASGPVYLGARPVNRASLFGPAGLVGHQDKQMMTRFEAEDWDVQAGQGLTVLRPEGLPALGVVICYDSEFPLLSRHLVEGGAELLLAPSCTETYAGFMRVRVGAMARALENQCPVVHAPLIGEAPWCAGVEENVGRAAIYGPPDAGWPETGILAEGGLNVAGWTYAEVDSALITRTRKDGVVLTHRDWPRQTQRIAKALSLEP